MTRQRPAVLGLEDENREGAVYFVDSHGGGTTWDAPTHAQWHKAVSQEDGGREFYFNPVTNEKQWVVPEESNLAWGPWNDFTGPHDHVMNSEL